MTASLAQRALARRVHSLERDLPAALDGDVEALHRSRVASRRLREILPALGLEEPRGRQAPVRKLRRRLRRLTSALGGVRELDVALGVLDSLRQQRPDLVDVLAGASLAVESDRRVCHDEMLRQLQDIRSDAFFGLLARLVEAASRPSHGTRVPLLRRRLARRADRLGAAVSEAGSLFAIDRLHRVRIAAKQLRYVLELIHEFGRVPTLRLVSRIKDVQDLLGRLHDLEIVAGYLQRQQGPGGLGQPGQVERAAEVVEREMRELHARYLPKVGALECVLSACRTEVDRRLAGDLTSRARRRQPWPTAAASTSSGTPLRRSAARSTRTTRSGR